LKCETSLNSEFKIVFEEFESIISRVAKLNPNDNKSSAAFCYVVTFVLEIFGSAPANNFFVYNR
jgi:hypothetical protein